MTPTTDHIPDAQGDLVVRGCLTWLLTMLFRTLAIEFAWNFGIARVVTDSGGHLAGVGFITALALAFAIAFIPRP